MKLFQPFWERFIKMNNVELFRLKCDYGYFDISGHASSWCFVGLVHNTVRQKQTKQTKTNKQTHTLTKPKIQDQKIIIVKKSMNFIDQIVPC